MLIAAGIVAGPAKFSKLAADLRSDLDATCLTQMIFIAAAAWTFVGSLTAFSLAGKRILRRGALIFCVWAAGVVGFTLLEIRLRPTNFLAAYFTISLFLCLIACAATFFASRQRRLISVGTCGLAAALVLSVIGLGVLTNTMSHWFPVLSCGLIPFPLAAAPLAVNVNRHG